MKEYIYDLFTQLGFQALRYEAIDLFTFTEESDKKVYWAVVEWENLEQIAEQSAIFSSCRELVNQPEIDKNLSLVILIKLNDIDRINAAKSAIIKVEENPYYFKKYVLHYADTEYEQIKTQQGEKTVLEFLTQQIVSADCFKTYKNEYRATIWQSLVYRLALKLPFLPVTIKTNKGLASLFEDNQLKVASKNLKMLDDHLSGQFAELTSKQIEEQSADDILNKLIPIIK